MTPAPIDPPELAPLRAASAGLLYPSESDEPFEAFAWPIAGATESAKTAVVARSSAGAAVATQTVEDFFSQLSGSADASRYDLLRKALTKVLGSVEIFRVGETNVAVFLIGRGHSAWIGLKTLSVET